LSRRSKRTRRSVERRREERELFFWSAHQWCGLARRVIGLIVLLILVVQLLLHWEISGLVGVLDQVTAIFTSAYS
jgi:hypothetical protein